MADEKQEVQEDRRMFEFNGAIYYIAMPTAEDIRGADWQYSKMFTKSLVENISTSSEMMDLLRLRGVIGPEFEQRRRELSDDLAAKVLKLQTANTTEEKQAYAMEVAMAREELFSWNQRLNGPMSNTCEQIADDSRLEYLTSRMIEHEDGSKLWETHDDFLKEKSQGLAVRSRFEVMLYLQGMDSDFIEQTPEAVAMKEVEGELKIKATQAIEELSRQQEAEQVAEEQAKEEKPKPKRTRKKATAKKKTTPKKKSTNKKSE